MPQYEYLCTSCGKKFSTVLNLSEHEQNKVSAPSVVARRSNSSGRRSSRRLLKRVDPSPA